EEWKVHFNSVLGLSGTVRFNPETREAEPGYLAENDVVTATAKPTAIEGDEVDQLTISFAETETGADMVLRWIETEVRVPIAAAGG
ncbi:MAG TPA: DUF2911 domain-containing protein, partial [Thermoanaerobaculia bacterium]|nr:DUF2911 domain-containing protein [Thermoanaerobaculia bacterium]